MKDVLLDTHTLIWMVSDEAKLGDHAKEVVFDSQMRKWISPASYWEMAIKIQLGKLGLNAEYDDFIAEMITDYSLEVLPIEPRHTSMLTWLDLHHKDPFDRLLVAQASVECMPIVSIDEKLDYYAVVRIWKYSDESFDDEDDGEVDPNEDENP